MNSYAEQPKPARRSIWILVAVFFAPLLLAFLLYYGMDGWRPAGSTNRGDLVQPPRPLPAITLHSPQGAEIPTTSWQEKWTLVYIGDGACDARCHEALTLMRQTRLALNDKMMRVQRVFLATGECCDLQYLDSEHEGLITAQVAADNPLLNIFAKTAGESVQHAGRVYIVDPLGNLMMSYEPQAPEKGLLEDLKKLLRLSHIG